MCAPCPSNHIFFLLSSLEIFMCLAREHRCGFVCNTSSLSVPGYSYSISENNWWPSYRWWIATISLLNFARSKNDFFFSFFYITVGGFDIWRHAYIVIRETVCGEDKQNERIKLNKMEDYLFKWDILRKKHYAAQLGRIGDGSMSRWKKKKKKENYLCPAPHEMNKFFFHIPLRVFEHSRQFFIIYLSRGVYTFFGNWSRFNL